MDDNHAQRTGGKERTMKNKDFIRHAEMYFGRTGMRIGGPVDLHGNRVSRTKQSHPYSYDAHVTYRNGDNSEIENTVYSDRLYQWDYKKYDRLCEKYFGNQGQYWHNRQPEQIEKFLHEYNELTSDKKVKLIVIMEGANQSSGYPYWVFMFKIVEQ